MTKRKPTFPRIALRDLTDENYPEAAHKPLPAPPGWLEGLRAGDWVEVRAGLNSGYGRVLGVFQVFRRTPSGRLNVNGESWARGAMVFNADGFQRGSEGPGTAGVFPPPPGRAQAA